MRLEPYEMFKVLAGETRIKIINILKDKGPLGPNEIAEMIGLTPASISQHLKILRHSGILKRERKGYWIPHSIDEEALEKCRCVLNQICACGCYGSGHFKEQEPIGTDMESLLGYKKELEERLKRINDRIREIEED